jgi:hypothetical protein
MCHARTTLHSEHMICTEEGWQPGDVKQSIIDDYGPEAILAEVNDPALLGRAGVTAMAGGGNEAAMVDVRVRAAELHAGVGHAGVLGV